ncbi:MAG: Maf-like protein YhdE [Alphaproteobacteria bacterium ADurb.Bin438]|nr:MAG: Maf-like protein YhdE [Alphaproteobacteria bacterium ADurb.Bin438]
MGKRILPKATNIDEAVYCIKLLSGRSHKVLTSVCLINEEGKISQKIVTSKVKFKNLSLEEIDMYLKSKEWEGKAGGYAIQGLASLFVKDISGSYSAIVGLPLFETGALLKGNGFWN